MICAKITRLISILCCGSNTFDTEIWGAEPPKNYCWGGGGGGYRPLCPPVLLPMKTEVTCGTQKIARWFSVKHNLPTTGDECALDRGLWPTVAPGETDPADDAAAKSAWRSCKACWCPCCSDPPWEESCCRNWRISWSSWICCSWADWGEGRSSWLCVCDGNTYS